MRVGLLFGSFNPIHTGHLIIANSFINYGLDKVWFVVSPQNPLKQSQNLLNAANRLHLVNLAIEKDNRFKTCDIEFHLPIPSYTIETLKRLTEQYKHEFFLIIGSDNYADILRWKSPAELLNNYKILVYERPGFPITERDKESSNITFIKPMLLDISSTEIRQLIEKGKSIHYLVPDSVRIEIETKGYYRK